MNKSLLDEMHEENVRLGCRCWDPPRDPNEIGHLEKCPALAHRRDKHLSGRDTLKAERGRAVALLREMVSANDKEVLAAFGRVPGLKQTYAATDLARAFLKEVDSA